MKNINRTLGICAMLILCISLVGMAMAKTNVAALKTCSDGIDNDGDGYTDLDDPGCINKNDMSELDPYVECDDGIDNDGDGSADYNDGGCEGPTDTDESNCGDGACEGEETQATCPADCGYPDSCSDSDDGFNYHLLGTVSGYYENTPYSNDDFCVDDGRLVEFYCAGDYKQIANVSCGTDLYSPGYCNGSAVYKYFTDYYCAGGACGSTTTTELVETCEHGCFNGTCNIIEDFCTDTDGGLSIYVFGNVSGYYNEYYYSNYDFCANDGMVVEFYCSGDYMQFENVSCGTDSYSAEYCSGDDVYKDFVDYYCASGACGSSPTPVFVETCQYGCLNGTCNPMPDSCTDTDGGWNFFEKGTTSGYLNEVPFSYTDYCNSTKVLVEYYCSGSSCGSYVFDMSMNESMECYDGAMTYI